MNIKCLKKCITVNPEKSWSAGETINLPEELAEKLLKNKNFAKVGSEKEQAEPELKNNEFNRKKRWTRDRN
jgi:hypothetical protein